MTEPAAEEEESQFWTNQRHSRFNHNLDGQTLQSSNHLCSWRRTSCCSCFSISAHISPLPLTQRGLILSHWQLFLSAEDTIDKWDLCRLRIETSLSRQSQNQSSSWRTRGATQLNGCTDITSLCSAHFFMLTFSAASSLDWERCERNALGSTMWQQHLQAELLVESHWTTDLLFSSSTPLRTQPSVAGLRAEVKSWRVFIEDRLGQRWRSVQAERKIRKRSRHQNQMFL